MDNKSLSIGQYLIIAAIFCFMLLVAGNHAEEVAPLPEIAESMRQEIQQELDTLPLFPGSEYREKWKIIKSTTGGMEHYYRVSSAAMGGYHDNHQQELVGKSLPAYDKPLRDYYYQQLLQRGWKNVKTYKDNDGFYHYEYNKNKGGYKASVSTRIDAEGNVNYGIYFGWNAHESKLDLNKKIY